MVQSGPPGLLSSLQKWFLVDDTKEDKISNHRVNCSVTLQGSSVLSDGVAIIVLLH